MIREDSEGVGGGASALGPLAGRLKYQRLARELEVELRTRYHPGQRARVLRGETPAGQHP